MNANQRLGARSPRPRSTGMTTAAYMRATNNGGGIEAVGGFDIGRVMAQGFGGRPLPRRLMSERLGEASGLQFAAPQFVMGKDDRVPIPDTTRLPWRCVCHLVVDGLANEPVLGTGWMAGPRTVLTTGHNLFTPATGRLASRVSVVPGRLGDRAPFNYFTSSKFDVHPIWRAQGDQRFDVGVIWLDAAVGEQLGWFGFASRADAQLQNLIVNTAGYPGDRRLGTQWFNAGRVSGVQPRLIEYGLDTEGGQSGSPIFMVDEAAERVVLAVHAYGGNTRNLGIRISNDIFSLFNTWVR